MKRKRKLYKIGRGSFEEQKLREDNKTETQKALLFILPVVMVAVLIIGVFIAYQGYKHHLPDENTATPEALYSEESANDPMLLSFVNSAATLESGYVPELTECEGVMVSAYIAVDLERMLSDAEAAGMNIVIDEGYISFEEQKERYDAAVTAYKKKSKVSTVKAEAYVKRTIPREGECEQQTGLIVSLSTEGDKSFEKTDEYAWLVKNSVEYGFILRYPENENAGGLVFTPHLFRYVGQDHAYFIRAYDMNFDEYITYLAAQ